MRTGENHSPDWAVIRSAYEAGGQSNRQLAKQFEVSEGAIRKRAKKEGWRTSDKAAYQSGTHREMIVAPRPSASSQLGQESASEEIERAASSDPKDLAKRGLRIILRLMEELEAIGEHLGEIEDVIIDTTKGDPNSRRRNAMMKAISHPVRTGAAKNLAQALSTLQASGPGKKEQAQDAAKDAGTGSLWGDDLAVAGTAAFN